ncbi:hypothetical protein KP509_05G028400 [Ceratopteris richardii]|uniref:Uncharacterized protein n=3 Tax=Ceratopteris richardii TaxID=49495 RepID=A0A8T2UKD6_CERRI|nr:hypothetical protein KP509_05G028400 [Ceratopteris richardii]
MPFRRKHRNALFGNKENVPTGNGEGAPEPTLTQPPGLFRCHSDNSQRFCSDINPNTVGVAAKNLAHHHRHSVLSTKEKITNLLELNSTLVKEVSTLRVSQLSLTTNVNELSQELQSKVLATDALQKQKEEIAGEFRQLERVHNEVKESFEAEKRESERRFESVNQVVENLQNMNEELKEEATRLREDVERHASEKMDLLEQIDKVAEEKTFLEDLVDSLRASEEAIRVEMQQALEEVNKGKQSIIDEKNTLLMTVNELECRNEYLEKTIFNISAEKDAIATANQGLAIQKSALEEDIKAAVVKHRDAVHQFDEEKQCWEEDRKTLELEKDALLITNADLERSVSSLLEQQKESTRRFETEVEAMKREAELIYSHKIQLEDVNAELLEREKVSQQKIIELISHQTEQNQMIEKINKELRITQKAAKEYKAEAEKRLSKVITEKDNLIRSLQAELKEGKARVSDLERANGLLASQQDEYVLNIAELDRKHSSALKCLHEVKALAKAKGEEASMFKDQLDKASRALLALESKLSTESDKQKRMEVHLQTVKGDLLIAEDAAIQAQNRVKAIEKEAANALERKTRESSQKIEALENKLAAMSERQCDMENDLISKKISLKAASRAENMAKVKLSYLLGIMEESGNNMQTQFEVMKTSILEVQNGAAKANQCIATFQSELTTVTNLHSQPITSRQARKKRRSRSRAQARQSAKVCN